MNYFRAVFSQNFKCLHNCFKTSISVNNIRHFCEFGPKTSIEKSVNHVILLGRVGINPQRYGTEAKPVVVFNLATNSNFKNESGELQQKTEWHRISIFKQHLCDVVLEHLTKGSRVYVEGRLLYGEFSDSKGIVRNTTTIVASDVIFIGGMKKKDEIESEVE